MDLGLEGRVALVAGGTSGLGLAAAAALSREGAAVGLCGRRHELAVREAAGLERAVGVEMDLRDADSVARAVDEVRERWGPIDVLVLNGGGPTPSRAVDLEVEVARDAAELLLFGPLTLVRHCLPDMTSRGWGRIVAISSSAVQQPIPGLATSSMFRVALASYLKLLAEDVAGQGLTVNMVLPGRLATARTAELDAGRAAQTGRSVEDVRAEGERAIPFGRYGEPDELAAVTAFLCSDAARYVTGEQVRVDGGMVRGL